MEILFNYYSKQVIQFNLLIAIILAIVLLIVLISYLIILLIDYILNKDYEPKKIKKVICDNCQFEIDCKKIEQSADEKLNDEKERKLKNGKTI